MCVVALALGVDGRWPLVFAGNRDERHDRASAPLSRWADAPGVVAGRDLTAGGTWLGVSETGRLATVTNVHSDHSPAPDRPSRGWLVRDILLDGGPYGDLAGLDARAFNPMNLLAVDGMTGRFWSNSPTPVALTLGPGVYGLGNLGGLEEASARVRRLKAGLAAWLADGAEALSAMLDLLADDSDRERPPMFLRNPVYGTRCSTVIRIGADGEGEIVERRFDRDGRPSGETTLCFRWPGAQA